MTRFLLFACTICCFLSCNFTTHKTGQLFVNQHLIETQIQSVQPAEQIDLSIQTTGNHDSMLVVRLMIDPKIPDSSLDSDRARQILNSFLTILPDLKSFTSCKIVFVKKQGSDMNLTRSVSFVCPMTAELVTNVENYKDSSRVLIGYIDPNWTYVNRDLNINLPLKHDWYFESKENDSTFYYLIGSDINQLPQYRTDPNRRVTFRTLGNLAPGDDYPVFRISKNNTFSKERSKGNYQGPVITFGLIMNLFGSEDEYLKHLYVLYFQKKIPGKDIEDFQFGNTNFRGYHFEASMKNNVKVNFLSVIKRFKRVSLAVQAIYSDKNDLEQIKQELNGLKIN